MKPLIEFQLVSKAYGRHAVFDEMQLTLYEGERLCLFGKNGSGKSTLLRLLAGLERPETGSVVLHQNWEGLSLKHPVFRRDLGFLGDQVQLYDELTVRENLELHASLRKVQWNSFVSILGLNAFLETLLGHCSRGVRRRAALARSLMGKPKLLLLDEPFANLDAIACEQLFGAIEEMTESTVVFATNNPLVSERLATRCARIQSGKLIDVESP